MSQRVLMCLSVFAYALIADRYCLGLRKVYPYVFKFSNHAKGRWVGQKLFTVLTTEFTKKEQQV